MNKKGWIIAGVIVLAVIVGGVLFGFGIEVGGVFSFTTDYSPEPRQAIEKQMTSSAFTVQEDVYLLMLDDYNCLYVGLTSTDEIFVGEMRVRNQKYHFMGNYTVFDSNAKGDLLSDGRIAFTESVTYTKGGIADQKLSYAVVFEEIASQSDGSVKVEKVQTEQIQDFWILYKLESK